MSTPASHPGLDALLREADWLGRLAHHLCRADAADDLVQETWLAALRSPPDPDRPTRPWLRQVLTNFARKRAREAGRRQRREDVVAAQEPPAHAHAAAVDELYEQVQLQQSVARMVLALDEPYRATVLLRYYQGRSAAEIAAQLGVPAGTVRWRLKEGLDRLRAELDRHTGGDRQRWVRVLLPVPAAVAAGAGGAGVGSKAAGIGKGALVMSSNKGLISVTAVTLAALVAGGAYLLVNQGGGDPHAAQRRASGLAQLNGSAAGLRVFGAARTPAAGARMEGVVQDPEGRPVPGAVVTVSHFHDQVVPRQAVLPAPPRGTRTDAGGHFVLGDVAPGTVMVGAHAPRFTPARGEKLTVAANETRGDLLLTLAPGGLVLSGSVQDSGGGPIAGAQVVAILEHEPPLLAQTDLAGTFKLGLTRGGWTLTVDAGGYAPVRARVDLLADMRRDFVLQPAGRVTGRVVDRSGAGVAGALVRAELDAPPGQSPVEQTLSREEGAFTFRELNPGRYQLSAAAGNRVGFASGKTAVTQAQSTAEVRITLEEAFTISGQVRDHAGRPVGSAHIRMAEAAGASTGVLSSSVISLADEDGRYRIEGVLPGRYRVGVSADPLAPALPRELEIKRASLTDVDFRLQAGARLAGIVLSNEGTPVEAATVFAGVQEQDVPQARSTGSGRALTGKDGRFLIEALGAGVLRVRVEQPAHGSHDQGPLPLAPGERKEVTVRFPWPAFIAGTVTWDDGGPAAGARVRWSAYGGGGTRTALVDADGTFRLGPLGAGIGQVIAELSQSTVFTVGGPEAPHKKIVTVDAGVTRQGVALVLARNDKTISGVVLDPDGRPLAGAQVYAATGPAPAYLSEREGGGSTSQEDGSFVLAGLVAGPHKVWAKHPQFAPAERNDVLATSTGVRLRFDPASALAGVAVDAEGRPVTDYLIAAVPPESPGEHNGTSGGRDIGSRIKVRDPQGAFSIDPLPRGRYDLLVTTADGRVGRLAAVALNAGDKKRGLRVAVGPGATIKGRVLDADTGQGVAGVGVGVRGNREHLHARGDDGGNFTIEGQIPGRTLLLMVRGPDSHVPEQREVTLPAGRQQVELPPIHLLAAPRSVPPADAAGTIGLLCSAIAGPPTVTRTLPGSVAERAGLRAGDVLRRIDARDVSKLGPLTVLRLLAGPVGTPVELTLETPGGGTRVLRLTREPRSSLPPPPLSARR